MLVTAFNIVANDTLVKLCWTLTFLRAKEYPGHLGAGKNSGHGHESDPDAIQLQIHAMVAGQNEGAATSSEAAGSVASDTGSVEDLEDDEVWKKVPQGKRKTLLRKERDALGKRVQSGLGKVSHMSSLFTKVKPP